VLVAEPGDHLDDERVELLYGLCPAHPGFEGVSQGWPVDSGEGAVEIVGVDGAPFVLPTDEATVSGSFSGKARPASAAGSLSGVGIEHGDSSAAASIQSVKAGVVFIG
jgi:hypothetical protein